MTKHLATICGVQKEFDLQFSCNEKGECLGVDNLPCDKSNASFKSFQRDAKWYYLGQGTVRSYAGEVRTKVEHAHFFQKRNNFYNGN